MFFVILLKYSYNRYIYIQIMGISSIMIPIHEFCDCWPSFIRFIFRIRFSRSRLNWIIEWLYFTRSPAGEYADFRYMYEECDPEHNAPFRGQRLWMKRKQTFSSHLFVDGIENVIYTFGVMTPIIHGTTMPVHELMPFEMPVIVPA